MCIISTLTFTREDSNDGSILIDMFDGVLNLEEATIWVERGGSLIVA